MEKLSFLIAFSVSTILLISSKSSTFANINPKSNVDEESLLAFKSRITSDPFDVLARNWSTSNGASFCFWFGVSCGANKRITSLDLHGWNLEGTIAPHLGNLTFLTSLDLSSNRFTGRIPEELSSLRRLKVLNLGTNNLEGIPVEMGNLSSLQILSIGFNQLTGTIPHGIFDSSSLQIIDLMNNSFSGTLPMNLCDNLSKLNMLGLSSNRLSGVIPSNIYKCKSLEILALSSNEFSGSIPKEIGELTKLRGIYISHNNLEGAIPNQVGNLTQLKNLSLGENKMTGEIPSELGNLKLEGLYLTANGFSGTIPVSIFNISTLTELQLSFNQFSRAQLPRDMGTSLPNLKYLCLGSNNLSGSIPDTINNASKLLVISIFNNSFTGMVPNLGNLRLLKWLFLGGNNLIAGNPNQELGFISSLANCPHLEKLDVSLNQFNGILPASFGNLSQSFWHFSAFDCHIKGYIPPTIGNLTGLKSVDLQGNELTGLIPKTIGELTQIEQIYLVHNRLQGQIPRELCRLSKLRELYLSHNMLNGTIPACFGDLKSLSKVFLDSNRLTSGVPNLWNNADLLVLNLSTNFLSGNISSVIPNLKSLSYLDMSWNQFSGDIPSYIGDLQSLEILSFAHNNLQGSIPRSTGDLRGLVSLDLSNNYISGYIPKSLESLMFLSSLDLSYNRLEGEIPKGGNFPNFAAKSFTMNYALCGDVRLLVPPCHVEGGSSKHVSFIKYILAPVVLAILAVALSIWLLRRRIANKNKNQVEISPLISWRRISYQELLRAIQDFGEANVIGRGSFGSVYKGTLSDGLNIAVKVFNMQLERAIKSFEIECEVMSTIRHKNLVRVISCCSNIDFKALVLEYITNGSLEKWLYSPNKSLDLLQRLNVAIDVALALEYLHHRILSPIIHCDLKPSNILIDKDMTARVGDFGIAKIFGEEEAFHQTITLATIGYMAPEYGSEGKVSTSCDIYSYGITLLELFTSKKPTDDMFTEEMSLKDWVHKAMQESTVTEVAAAGLLHQQGRHSSQKEQCVSSIFDLAMKCLAISPHERINMIETVVTLKKIKSSFLTSMM